MAIVAGEVCKFTVFQTWNLQQVLNVFYYQQIDSVALGNNGVPQAFWDYVKTAWRACVVPSSTYTFNRVTMEVFNTAGDYGEYIIPTAEQQGTRVLDPASYEASFLAASLKFVPENRTVRPGGKRIAGMLEQDHNANNLDAAYLTLLQALADKFDDNIAYNVLGVDNMRPVVYGYGRPRVEPAHAVPVQSVVVSPYTSSQVSRKLGHGV